MDGGLEDAGALVTAAAAAHVVDSPARGTAAAGLSESHCRNCGAALAGPWCHVCGQRGHVHRSLHEAVEEFLHGVLHFDSKLWRTLPLLAFRPGRLTREYVGGKRARYISPVALFLLTMFTMFLLLGLGSGLTGTTSPGVVTMGGDAEIRTDAIRDAKAALAGLEADLARARASGSPEAAGLEMGRAATAALVDRLEKAEKGARGEGASAAAGGIDAGIGQLDIDLGNPAIEQKVRDSLRNPDFVFYKMKQKGYKLSFLLVPMSLPWMLLLFIGRKDVRAYDHVIFLLYSLSFMSVLFMAGAILSWSGVDVLGTSGSGGASFSLLFLMIPLLHMFVHLKGAYALGPVAAAWRSVALWIFAGITLLVYFLGILALGLLD
ncbi:DUF3667 domain-containing protein [Sandaracinobacteroides sp. A072]|uniref:DUF3667 domain-containing protein n=1 Tax=Sandaracinobacteroides sp. A072 TaxID=3461146 RepID=UPI004041FB55